MIFEQDNKYYRQCDDCGEIVEIQKQFFRRLSKKSQHWCSSCRQKGSRNHSHGLKPWNYGLTKDTDTRVQAYGLAGSATKQGCEPWNKGNTYATLKGEEWAKRFKEHVSAAKKGVPNLRRRFSTRHNKSFKAMREACKELLYITWKRPILERDEFCCQICGAKRNLEVHHLKPFRQILREAASISSMNLNQYDQWSPEEFEHLRSCILSLHTLEDGITLCRDCHKEADEYRKRFIDD